MKNLKISILNTEFVELTFWTHVLCIFEGWQLKALEKYYKYNIIRKGTSVKRLWMIQTHNNLLIYHSPSVSNASYSQSY